jgi:positive regulator of sigma E activity
MTNPARITQIDNDGMVHARYIKPTGEKGATSRKFWNVKERSFPVENSNGVEVSMGDYIEVSVKTGLTIGAAFLVFMVPLLLFALAYGLGSLLFTSEGLKVLSGLTGLALGLVLPAGINLLKKDKNYPQLERVLTMEQLREIVSCDGCESCGGCG